LTAKATGLELAKPNGGALANDATDKPETFKVRKTTAHVLSDRLLLAELPIDEPLQIGDTSLMLGGLVLDLRIGQPVVLNGERADATGVMATEVLLLEEVIHQAGFTTLYFESGLEHPYIRKTVAI